MSIDSPAPAVEASPVVPVLDIEERRVLGVMVEKAKTTPDVYPLSVNALVTGCNQKSNRDPVLDLSEPDVEEALARVQQKGLAIKITGGRVVRWRHNLYDAWRLSKVELAVLAELLLRGPQTEGELRSRASRMEPIADLDTLRALLRPLVERRLVVYLSPEGRRGTMLTHGFHAPEELEHLRARHQGEAMADAEPSPASRGQGRLPDDGRQPVGHQALAAFQEQVAQLSAAVTDLRSQVASLEQRLHAGEEERRELSRQMQQLQQSQQVQPTS